MTGVKRPKIGYLFSRYPVFSQTFCDTEMLALEAAGAELVVGSLNPPPSSFRHERLRDLRAEVIYPAPPPVMKARFAMARRRGGRAWEPLGALIEDHENRYGPEYKAALRARNAIFAAEEFCRRGVDHVHVHFTNRAAHTALFMKAYAGLPFSITAHGQDFMLDLGNDDLLAELLREAEFVVAVSDYSAELLRRRFPESAQHILRIYNGLAYDEFRVPPASNRATGRLRLVTVGRLIEFKGFHHLIDACASLRKRHDVDLVCNIIGTGDLHDRLAEQIGALGLEHHVSLRGVMTQEQIKSELAAADAFVLPSIVDSKGASDVLPTVILEAMASGLPVVSTRVAGVPEMVVHDVTGLLVAPGDPRQLGEQLYRLAVDPDLRLRLGQAGRARVQQMFSLPRTAAVLLQCFEDQRSGRDALHEQLSANRTLGNRASEILCLVDGWPGDECSMLNSEVAWLTERPEFRLIAMSCDKARLDLDDADIRRGLSRLQFLPDALVLEADWAAMETADLETLAAYDSLEPRLEVLGAIHLAQLVRKRGIRHIHAMRAATAETAWLIHLLTGVRFTVGLESRHALGEALLERIVRAAESIEPPLDLVLPAAQRQVKIGPIRFSWPPGKWLESDRSVLYQRWYEAL